MGRHVATDKLGGNPIGYAEIVRHSLLLADAASRRFYVVRLEINNCPEKQQALADMDGRIPAQYGGRPCYDLGGSTL